MKNLVILLLIVFVTLSITGCYSCRSWNKMWGKGEVEPGTEGKLFFDKDCKLEEIPLPVSEPPLPACGSNMALTAYPGGGSDVVRISKDMPMQVEINRPFDYVITVANVANFNVVNIKVTEILPDGMKFVSSEPQGTVEGNRVTWILSSLGGQEAKDIHATLTPTRTDCNKTCATLTYDMPACANTSVVQPALAISKTSPDEVTVCDPIPIEVTLTNIGTGDVDDIDVNVHLASGVMTETGMDRLTFRIDSLAPGETEIMEGVVKAESTGKYVHEATAKSANGLVVSAMSETLVTQPILKITSSSPELRYLGRSVIGESAVTNVGDTTAYDTMINAQLPIGIQDVSTSHSGIVQGESASWSIGSLEPGETQIVTIDFIPTGEGEYTQTATASAFCADDATTSTATLIKGIPAILLEVVDISDPIEIGTNTTYVITATNQGSKTATNIRIACGLEDEMEFVSAVGPTEISHTNGVVVFEPLAGLPPQEKAAWRITVRALSAGDIRFKAVMNTDQLDREVMETEATHLYE